MRFINIIKDILIHVVKKNIPMFPVVELYKITSAFGSRINPVTKMSEYHTGIDIGCGKDMVPVYACADGKIFHKNHNPDADTGICIWIDHGGYISDYMHMHGKSLTLFSYYKIGDDIKKGEHIGYIGTTGRSTGAHLHFEIYSILKNGVGKFDNKINKSYNGIISGTPVRYYNPKEYFKGVI